MASRRFGWVGECGILLGVLALPSFAAAQECADDGDCGDGFVCESYGTVDCGYACPEGEACEPPPDCAPMEIKACAPAPCTDDSECPDGMVCFAQTVYECPVASEIDCPPGTECPKPTDPPECTETSESTCVPQYVPPCTESADCGLGFTCVEYETCSCSGSAGAGSSGVAGSGAEGGGSEPSSGSSEPSDGGVPVPPEETCTCEPAGEFYCELTKVECTDGSECPAGFTCEDDPETVVCSAPTEPAGTGGSSGSADGSADAGVADAQQGADAGAADAIIGCGDPVEPKKVCMPPYWETVIGIARDATLESGAPASGADNGSSTATGDPGAAPTTAEGTMETGASNGSGGGMCAAAGPGAASRSGLAGLLGIFALVGLAWRRRRLAA